MAASNQTSSDNSARARTPLLRNEEYAAMRAQPGRDDFERQAALEWAQNAGGCRDRFISQDVFTAWRRVELAGAVRAR